MLRSYNFSINSTLPQSISIFKAMGLDLWFSLKVNFVPPGEPNMRTQQEILSESQTMSKGFSLPQGC